MNTRHKNHRFAIRIVNIMLCMILSVSMYMTSIAPAVLVFAEEETQNQEQVTEQAAEQASEPAAEESTEAATESSDAVEAATTEEKAAPESKPAGKMKAKMSTSAEESAEDSAADAEASPEEEAEEEPVIENPAAKIGKRAFASLVDAIEKAASGDIIVLQRDIKEKVSVEGKKIEIDLNGHRWTAKGGSNRQFARVSSNAELTIENGMLSGGKAKGGEEAALYNNGGKLTLKNIKLTNGIGEQIRNDNGTLVIKDSEFYGNTAQTSGSYRYIVYNTGYKAKAEISESIFKNNTMPNGGIIYSGSGSGNGSHALRLNSSDIKHNTVYRSSVYCGSSVHLYMNDTTISGNESTYRSSGNPAGLRFSSGWLEIVDSAIYKNKAPASVYDRDIYLYPEDIYGGEIPLPSEMSDHGKSLADYELVDNRYSKVMTEPITKKSNSLYRELTLEPKPGTEVVAEYNGTRYTSVAEAVKAMSGKAGTVRIIKDIDINETIEAHDGIVIDLDGHTVKAKSGSRPVFSINGGEVTVKNGSIKEGKCNTGSAINTADTALTLKDLKIENCKGDAVWARFNNTKDKSRQKVDISSCEFTANGSDAEDYAVSVADCDLSVKNCKFDGNTGGVRAYESEGNTFRFALDNSDFINGTDQQLDLFMFKGNESVISNCTFKNNAVKNSKSIIRIEARSSGAPVPGGVQTFNNCTISDNSGASEATILAETGEAIFNGCVISGNSARDAGAIYVDPTCDIKLKDTVVKNNKASSATSNTSGGIVLRSAQYVLITPSVNGSTGSSSELGFYASSLDMEGGAIYGNDNGGASPSADDLRVFQNCELKVPKVADMKDGDYNFTGLFWVDDAKTDAEMQPAESDAQNRYYKVGIPGGIKQIYVDGVNGDDTAIGTKDAPVKTFEVAAELAAKYKCKNILVRNTVSVSGSKKTGGIKKAMSKSETAIEDSKGPKTLDFGGATIKREKGFVGLVLLVEDGADLTLKNVTMDGDSAVWVKAEDSLIRVEKDAKLTIGKGVSLQNNGYNRNKGINKGGAIHCLGDLVMNDGASILHNYAVTGGGICVDGGMFIMNGGLIDDNVALFRVYSPNSDYNDSYGGGVCLINGAVMEMNDGMISNNEALNSGGGVALGTRMTDTVTKNGTITFIMRGGTLDSNVGYVGGGGINVQCNTEAYIAAGSIINNYAKNSVTHTDPKTGVRLYENIFAGGGIYVNGYHDSFEDSIGVSHGKLYLTNVEIADNTAEWTGGAIAVCGTGNGNVSNIKGTVIHDNDARGTGLASRSYDGDYDVFFDNYRYIWDYKNGTGWTINVEDTLDYESYLSELMLNGGEYNWTDEEGDLIDVEKLHKLNTKLLANTDATASDADVKASVAKARVHVNGNRSATNGGGIGCNGEMHIGQLPDHIDISVEKKWADKGHEKERPASIKIDLYRDGELYTSKEVSADENGDWNAKFEDLPEYKLTKNGEQTKEKHVYEIKEDVKYKPAGSSKAIDEVYGTKVTDNGDGSWTVVNAYTEVLTEFEEEEKDTTVLDEYSDEREEKPKDAENSAESAETKVKGASTGDDAMAQIWILMLLVSAAILTAAVIRRRRANKVNSD